MASDKLFFVKIKLINQNYLNHPKLKIKLIGNINLFFKI